MQEIIEIGLLGIGAVLMITLIYRLVPYKQWQGEKPSFVLFPKYIAQYSLLEKEMVSNIQDIGFTLKPGSTNTYTRGKLYGDFSAKFVKLHIEIDQDMKSIKVFTPFLGIVFDTGDLWMITSNILKIDN